YAELRAARLSAEERGDRPRGAARVDRASRQLRRCRGDQTARHPARLHLLRPAADVTCRAGLRPAEPRADEGVPLTRRFAPTSPADAGRGISRTFRAVVRGLPNHGMRHGAAVPYTAQI